MKHEKSGPVHAVPSYIVRVVGEHGSAVLSRPEFVPGQVDCYLSSRPAGVVSVTYAEHCAHCSGAGRVYKSRRKHTWKPCPVCKGAPERVSDIPLATHDAYIPPVLRAV